MIYITLAAQIMAAVAMIVHVPQTVIDNEGTVGRCHPYPGAVAADCLELIGNMLDDNVVKWCQENSPDVITLRECSIVSKCTKGPITYTSSQAVRQALTAIGACALFDYGSISGDYTADNGMKTCYLYPGSWVIFSHGFVVPLSATC